MKRARSIEDFVADPVGRYQLGRTHVVWCHSPSLCGSIHWGRPTDADAAALVRRLEIAVAPGARQRLRQHHRRARHGVVRLAGVRRRLRLRAPPPDDAQSARAQARHPRAAGARRRARRWPVATRRPELPRALLQSAEEAQAWIDRPDSRGRARRGAAARRRGARRDAAACARCAIGSTTRSPTRRCRRWRARSASRRARCSASSSRHETSFRLELMDARVRAACLLLDGVRRQDRSDRPPRRLGLVVADERHLPPARSARPPPTTAPAVASSPSASILSDHASVRATSRR